ncbi:MAG: HAMP domain-containing histidine kinase [Lachnospiraceae bacterium]|nr:HAMP domain-containing histidine kinase [Lachnospiraceae bacterium]
MSRSLYSKFILGYLLFGLIGFITIATFSSHTTYVYLLEKTADSMYDEANLLASAYSDIYQGKDLSLDIARPQLEAVATYLNTQAWVLDNRGTVIAETSPATHVNMVIDGFDPTITGNESYMIGQFFGMFPSETLSVWAPITGNFNTYGYVVLHMPMTQVQQGQNEILNLVYMTALVIFVLSLVILLVFTLTVYFPLKRITAGAMEYADGNLDYTIQVHTNDEMGYLANTLNYMSDELNKMEEYQKSFIANVSHDFRSPLTSIKGYLEAILDGTIPPELYDKYLNIVIAETERLNKLTQSMLAISSMDSKGFLSRSNFDINRVIKDTAATFEGTCNAKNIVLDLTFTNDTQMVYADLGKIQQVLYNLIDNAIKFSHPDSVIYIQTYLKFERVFISVKDTGIGIPKDSIKKIWNRFYKTDLSRGKDKRGTGLGLAIVKDIIQAHGENIDVVSTEGVGTEFIFTLSKPGNM